MNECSPWHTRPIWSSYVYRVFRLIDSEFHVTPENAIFVEFEQCLAWAFIDLPSQARNAPICAPGKKRETLSFSLPLHVPFSRKPREKGYPREIRRRVVWFMTEVLRHHSPLPNFVKLLLALFSIPSRSHVRVFLFLLALTKFKLCLFFSPLTLRSIMLLWSEKLRAVPRFDIGGRPAWSISFDRAFRFWKLPPLWLNTLITAMYLPMKRHSVNHRRHTNPLHPSGKYGDDWREEIKCNLN